MGNIEQALLVQTFFELVKGQLQGASPLGDQMGAVELIGAVPGIDSDPANGDYRHPVLGDEPQRKSVALEQDTAKRPIGILNRKIMVTRGVSLIVADLAPHTDILQRRVVVKKVFHIGIQLRNR